MQEQALFKLIEQFDKSSITSLDFKDDEIRIHLKKNTEPLHSSSKTQDKESLAIEKNITKPNSLSMPSHVTQDAASGTVIISSPIVAAFYACAAPDTPPFVKVGGKVKTGDTLCILEAMKMMNKLLAEFDCEIVAIKAASGDLVEYGAPLFEVKKL